MKIKYHFLSSVKIWYHFFTSEKNRTSSSQVRRVRTCTDSSQVKMWNLSTDFRPLKLSKLTIRKFHICQKWCFCTNSSHGVKCAKCEICGSTWPSIQIVQFILSRKTWLSEEQGLSITIKRKKYSHKKLLGWFENDLAQIVLCYGDHLPIMFHRYHQEA